MADSGDARFRRLGETVAEAMGRLHVPGVAVGVVQEGEQETAGFGLTNVDHPLAVDATTLFQVGSITKTFVATAAMRLVERGELDLDAPVREYVPDLRLAGEGVAARVTLRHLFTHTAGWVGDYFDDVGSGDDALAKIVARMADLPRLTPLGEVWSYNNAGFYLAGRAIELVTGQTFEAAIQELVFDPLRMDRTFFSPADVMTHRFAVGHRDDEGRPVVLRPWALPRSANAAGGIVSNVQDMLRYARFQLGDGRAPDGTRLLSTESLRLMQAPLAEEATLENLADAIGVAWMLRRVEGIRLVEHGGATHGQRATLTLAPERGFAVCILTNAERGDELHRAATARALQEYLGIAEPEPPLIELPDASLSDYASRYTARLRNVELRVEDGGLVMQVTPRAGFPTPDVDPPPAPPPMRLAFYGDDRVVVLDGRMEGLRGAFLRRPDGSIAWFRIGGRIAAREPYSVLQNRSYVVPASACSPY